MTRHDWCDTMPSKRKRVLRSAIESYESEGLSERDITFKAFVKQECLPSFEKYTFSMKMTNIAMVNVIHRKLSMSIMLNLSP